MELKVYSVSYVNKYIKMMFDRDDFVNMVAIQGEITNFKLHSSGHLYFTLKDEASTIKCVMFKNAADKLKFKVADGQSVTIIGGISVYEVGGTYQVYVRDIVASGEKGVLYERYEALKKKLSGEGLFDESHKKKIPFMPKRVGVITSSTGAVIRDIINVSTRRFRGVNLLIYPAAVQGEKVSQTVISGIKYFNDMKNVDVIIIARGGGSFEDLFGFNDELLAREAYQSLIPIISAVGHETDFTILDFVSDLRAPTPSAAAELVYPSRIELSSKLHSLSERLNISINTYIDSKKSYLNNMKSGRLKRIPEDLINKNRILLDSIIKRSETSIKTKLNMSRKEFENIISLLDSYSPLKTLKRGYSVIKNKDSRVISSISNVLIGEELTLTVQDGSIISKVESVVKN